MFEVNLMPLYQSPVKKERTVFTHAHKIHNERKDNLKNSTADPAINSSSSTSNYSNEDDDDDIHSILSISVEIN